MSTNYQLLTDVRVYLRERVRGMEPDSELLEAWDDFFATYDGLIRKFAAASGVQRWQVDDCVREVWAVVAEELDKFEIAPERGPGRFRKWLYQMVRRTTSRVVHEHIQWLTDIEADAQRRADKAQRNGQAVDTSE